MPDMHDASLRYWLWLSLAVYPGSACQEPLLTRFENDPYRIYTAGAEDYSDLELSDAISKNLLDKNMDRADSILAYCKQHGIFLLTPASQGYPERLLRISRMPLVLYCKGTLPDLDREATVAMVGTRRMTSYGKRMTYEIAYDLAKAGAIVVSGLALGIDAIAHRACLDAGGFTVAVLGCGIDISYPKENFDLMEEIEKKGLVISEYPPGTRPYGSNFPTRNRIISGLCLGTLVVEADSKSGALITAEYARKQNRDLFALPGMVGEQNSEGTNALIRSGAIPVTDAKDILCEYELLYPTKLHTSDIPAYRPKIQLDTPKAFIKKAKEIKETKKENVPKSKTEDSEIAIPAPASPSVLEKEPEKECIVTELAIPQGLADLHADIYRTIATLGQPTQDEIIAKSGLSASNAMVALTVLEIKGHILSRPGGRYCIQK